LAPSVVEIEYRIGNGLRVARRNQVTALLVFHHFHQSADFADNNRFSETKSQLHYAALGSTRIWDHYQVSRGKIRLHLFIGNVVARKGHLILQIQLADEIPIKSLFLPNLSGNYK